MGVRDVVESLLVERAAFSTPQVAQAAGVSRQAAHKHLKLLVKQGVLEVQGKARAARYHGRNVNRAVVGDSVRAKVDGGAQRSRRRGAVRRARGAQGARKVTPPAPVGLPRAAAPASRSESVQRAAEAAAAWRARVAVEAAPTQRGLEMATLRARLGLAVEVAPTQRARELAALRAWLESSADVEPEAFASLAPQTPLAQRQVDDSEPADVAQRWALPVAESPAPPEESWVDDSQALSAVEPSDAADAVAALTLQPGGKTPGAGESVEVEDPARPQAAHPAPRPDGAPRKPAALPAWLRACALGFKVLAQTLPAAPRARPRIELPPLKARAPGPAAALPVAPGVDASDAAAPTVTPTHARAALPLGAAPEASSGALLPATHARAAPPLGAAPEASPGALLQAVHAASEPPETAAVALPAVPGSLDAASAPAAGTQRLRPVDTTASHAPWVDDSRRASASTAVPTAAAGAHGPAGSADSLRSTWVRAGVDDSPTAAAAPKDAAPSAPPQAPGPERVTLSVQSAGAEFRLSARILLCDVSATELVIDFAGIEDVGDEFLEEVLVRYAESHPAVRFEIVNAAAAVRAAVASLLAQGVAPAGLTIHG